MKIVNITGGLGNQMFQYAFAISLKERFPEEEVYVDISHYHTLFFKHYKGINLHNGFEIDKVFPKANLPIAGIKQISKVSYYIPNYVLSRLGRKLLPQRKTELIPSYSKNYSFVEEAYKPGNRYYEGFWQCIKNFEGIKDKLVEVFAHPEPNEYNSQMISEINTFNSVGIHIRRGDYLNEPEFCNICDIDYYKKGIELILSDGLKHDFYIFSNDMDWCKENIAPLVFGNDIHYVTKNKGKQSCWDMFLMTYCKDLIIANSSFSWWGAFLNKNVNRVVVPDPWLNRDCEIDNYEKKWIRIKG